MKITYFCSKPTKLTIMVKTGENSIEQTVIKKAISKAEMYYQYFNQLSALGLKLTKVQTRILSCIALNYSTIPLKTEERKKIVELVETTSQVVENTFVVLRKKGVLQKDNTLHPRFRIKLLNGYRLSIIFKDEQTS